MQEAFHPVIRIKQSLAHPNSSASSPPFINKTDTTSTLIKMNPLTSILSCLTGQSAASQPSLQVSEINPSAKAPIVSQPVPYSDDAVSQFVTILQTHTGTQAQLHHRLKQVVSTTSWTSSLAEAIERKIENLLKDGAELAKPMAEAVKRATNTAWGFAKEHPVYAGLIAAGTIIAIGVLVEFELVWVLRALGFDEVGPRIGSFAARWMSSLEKVPKGSIYSFLQRLGMKIAK
ncbi:lincomycin-condensing lmbA [Fusarium pseudocircinatum]|uniref:Lincomycin-condensing lmbA n=1 Tax=Fusarium pseudocircinatum TaxID=56676 RepID=A0A8H5NWR1_9HYPO|nr:lincomycin-condensing lmbA [Fusarium pseudocircinatum]